MADGPEGGDMAGSVFIAAISSDIGGQLARRYRDRGYDVIGTYRSEDNLEVLRNDPAIHLLRCDISEPASIAAAVSQFASLGMPWETFISAVGQLSPVGNFFTSDMGDWSASVWLNSVAQLQLLHAMFPHRQPATISKVGFLVGGGINGPFTNYSAYCLGKIMLVKMCELLDDEYPDIHTIAVGTGWVDTKIHRQTLEASHRAGTNYERTVEMLSSGRKTTSYQDIFDCIDWSFGQQRQATGGRNFSVVHDAWRREPERLLKSLLHDSNRYKLRRHGN
jgi:NAD(P)-dependent dehydrogenase (short-subunit alcohol dehydrogenase family)